MEARELRIGNFVFDHTEHAKKVGEVSNVVGMAYVRFENEMHLHPNPVIMAIPLTQEWIDKFDSNLQEIGYSVKETITGRFEVYVGISYLTTLDYVHEYQNLFFILTGMDLLLIE